MKPIISDVDTDARMSCLERFLQQYLGPRQPGFGEAESELSLIEMPEALRRFLRFAGRWPGHNPRTPYANRFCMQDTLCAIRKREYAPTLQLMDDLLVFVWENQGVWVAATERTGIDPPVWLSENWSTGSEIREWKRLQKPLSHFLVSFVLQELLFGSETLGIAPSAMISFERLGIRVEPVWIEGEYACDFDRPSYFLADDRILIRSAPNEADGDDWYGCNCSLGTELLTSLRLPRQRP